MNRSRTQSLSRPTLSAMFADKTVVIHSGLAFIHAAQTLGQQQHSPLARHGGEQRRIRGELDARRRRGGRVSDGVVQDTQVVGVPDVVVVEEGDQGRPRDRGDRLGGRGHASDRSGLVR